jgi:hypothetical protein
LVEVAVIDIGNSKGSSGEIDSTEVAPLEFDSIEFGFAEVRPAEVYIAKFAKAEVNTCEVSVAEVGRVKFKASEVSIAKIDIGLWIFFSPSIPLFYSLVQDSELSSIWHGLVLSASYI